MIQHPSVRRAGLPLAVLLASLGVVAPAAADEPARPPERATTPVPDVTATVLILVLDGLPPGIAPEQVRAAIARELSSPVALASAVGEEQGGVLFVSTVPGTRVLLSYRAPDRRVTAREIELPPDLAGAVELVALLAGNLVRDEAAELAAAMARQRPAAAPAPVVVIVTAPSPPPPPPSLSPCAVRREAGLPFGLDFLPFVGTSSAAGQASVRSFSLNALGGIGGSLVGAEIGGLFNIETRSVCGVQIGGLANVVPGPLAGAQVGGLVNVASGGARGAQVAGVMNLVEAMEGAQIAGVVNVAAAVRGAQIGVVNVTRGEVSGVQIGVVNYADDADLAIGVISIVRRGRTHVDVSGSETGLVMAAVEHGGKRFHNLYGVGVRVVDGRFATQLGFGLRFPLEAPLHLDVDVLHSFIFPAGFRGFPTQLWQLRPTLGVRLFEGLALFGGPTLNAALDRGTPANALLAPYRSFAAGEARLWPGATLGVQGL